MKNCIISGEEITSDNDSKAHVIPSALGGRLKPRGILSDEGNAILNDSVDLPLIRAFQPIMTLLGGSRDRGANPAIKMTDEAGKSYMVAFNQPLALTASEFSVTPTESEDRSAVEIKIAARTKKEARTLLGKVKKLYPDFDINEAMQRAALIEAQPTGMIGAQLQIGPSVVFPAAFAAASIFSVYNSLSGHPDLSTYVSSVDPTMIPVLLPPDTFYWYPPEGSITTNCNEVTHVVALITDASLKRSLFYVEYFNISCVGVLLPYAGELNQVLSYGVDVINGKEISVSIDEVRLRSIEWAATHKLGEDSLYQETQRRASRVIGLVQQRAQSVALSDLVTEVLGKPDGRPITKGDIEKLSTKLSEFIARRLRP